LNGALPSSYALLADSGEAACGPLVDFCMSGAAPVYSGKEVCLPEYFSSTINSCQRFAACGPTMPLADGVELAGLVTRFAGCEASQGGSDCSCSDSNDLVFPFHLSAPPNDASCEAAIPMCDRNAVVQTQGAVSCEPQAVDTPDVNSCERSSSCVQEATADGQPFTASGFLRLWCRRTQAGTASWCSCGSDQKTARFQLGATGANASQACTQATNGCIQRVGGVRLGLVGDPGELPDPLP
jgi:hypothetical protein